MKLSKLLLLRAIKARPLRMILSMFGIILGVASILSIGITNQTALESISKLFEDTSGKASLVLINADTGKNGFSDLVFRSILNYPGVESAAPAQQATTLLADEAASSEISFSFFGAQMGGLMLYGIDPVEDQRVHQYTITEGEFLEADNTYEIVLVENFANDQDIKVGNRIEIITPDGLEELHVIGLMKKDGLGQLNNGNFGVLPLKAMQKMFNRGGDLDQIDIVVQSEYQDSESLEILRNHIQEHVGEDLAVIYPANQGKRMTQMLESYQIGLNFLSGIALFVGAFLIYNAFAMTVVERTREFGMLRTVGMTRKQIVVQVLLEAALLGLIGSAIGIAAGLLMSQGLTKAMEVLLGQDLGQLKVPRDILVTGLLVGILVTVLATLIPAWQAGRISPLEALRARAKTKENWIIREGWKVGVVLLGVSVMFLLINPFPYDVQFRLGSITVFSLFLGAALTIPVSVDAWEKVSRPILGKVYGNSGQLGSRNIQRSRFRTTLTVAALMVGVAMILIVRAMTSSFGTDLESWIDAYIGGDLYVTSSLPMGTDIQRRLESVEGVQAAAPMRYLDVTWRKPDGTDEELTFMAIEPYSYISVTSFVFSDSTADDVSAIKRLLAGDSVFISSVLADKSGLNVGEKIKLRTRSGYHDFEIAAIVVDFYNQGQVIQGGWNDMRRYFKINDANTFLLSVKPGFDITRVQEKIEDLYGKRFRLTIESNLSIKNQINVLLDQAFGMFDVLALIAMVVASLGVINTLTMNVMERLQEIGMLRGVGMTRGQIVKMILAEAGLIGVIGGVLGLLLGMVLSRIFFLAMTAMSGYELNFQMPIEAIFTGIIVAVVVSQIAAILPARRASQINILEALHYE